MIEMLPPPGGNGPEIRQLTPEEYASLAPRFESRGFPLPTTATATGIFDQGKMVGYQVIQVRLHAQPTEIDQGYSHLFSALCRKSEEVILQSCGPSWVYVFVEPGDMEKLVQSRGLVQEPWTVYSKLISGDMRKPVLEMMPVDRQEQVPVTEEGLEQYPGTESPEPQQEVA
jgi:hypothetical protein